MSASQLVNAYEKALRERPMILGQPGGALSALELAGQMIRAHGLAKARELAAKEAAAHPSPWDLPRAIMDILAQAVAE